jgi:multiple sugar transport system permease protein
MEETRAAPLTAAAPAKRRNLASRLGITLAGGGLVQGSDLRMMLILFLPGFIILVLLGTYPLISVLRLAFERRSLFDTVGTWIGIENFRIILQSPLFWEALVNDLVYTFTTVPLQLVLGLAIALLLHQNFPGRNVFRGFLLFSYVVPTAVATIVWRFMLSDSVGIIYYGVRDVNLGIPNTWFASTATAMPTVVMITVWKFFPFMVINLLAGLQSIDEQLYEAAKVDGASRWQVFRFVTLPMLMPVIAVVTLLRTVWTFNNWDVIALLTDGGPLNSTQTLPLMIYDTMFREFSIGRAAALSFIAMMVLLVAMVGFMFLYRRTEEKLQ